MVLPFQGGCTKQNKHDSEIYGSDRSVNMSQPEASIPRGPHLGAQSRIVPCGSHLGYALYMHALRYTVGAGRTGQINTPAWPVEEVGGHLQVYLEEQLKQETKLGEGVSAQCKCII